MELTRADWDALRQFAWEWNPIGLDDDWRAHGEDEYDCIIEKTVAKLLRNQNADEIAAELNAFVPEHFGIGIELAEVVTFANDAVTWWQGR